MIRRCVGSAEFLVPNIDTSRNPPATPVNAARGQLLGHRRLIFPEENGRACWTTGSRGSLGFGKLRFGAVRRTFDVLPADRVVD